MSDQLKKQVGESFLDIANAMKTGKFGQSIKIGLTLLGSEHGEKELLSAAELAAKDGSFEVLVIGKKIKTNLELVEVKNENEMHKKMEELIDNNTIAACVTLHYNFPIGISTVGRVVAPANGRNLIIATTTGTSATNRSEAMFKNAISGIAVAKATGISKPTVGILNVDSSKTVERSLKKLKDQGYDINFAESKRADGGSIMRGNDLLMASSDVMVTDSLTGNILMKMFSSSTTGGSYESTGYGYGPGIGEGVKRSIYIISRASGAAVIINAIKYAAECAKGNLIKIVDSEFVAAKAAGFDQICSDFSKSKSIEHAPKQAVTKEPVTADISGIDVLDLDDGVALLMSKGIYAESGMGCTGPIIMVNQKNLDKSKKILKEAEFTS